jgi:hypothetical protein
MYMELIKLQWNAHNWTISTHPAFEARKLLQENLRSINCQLLNSNNCLCLVYVLFNDTVSSSDHVASDDRIINEWTGEDLEGSGHGLIKVLSWHLPGVTEENHKNLSRDSWSPGQYLNPRPPEYEAGVLTTQRRHSVKPNWSKQNGKHYILIPMNSYIPLGIRNIWQSTDKNTLVYLSEK